MSHSFIIYKCRCSFFLIINFPSKLQTAVFMGCKSGEIELGLSNVPQVRKPQTILTLQINKLSLYANKLIQLFLFNFQINIKRELMRNWLPEAFSRQLSPHTAVANRPKNPDQQNPLSSSSSSFRSLSTMDSPEYSSILFNIPTTITTSHINIPEVFTQPAPNPLQPINIVTSLEPMPPLNIISSSITSPHQQALQAFSRTRNTQFPNPEIEDAAMTRAILAVLSASPSSSSSHQPPPQTNVPPSSSTAHFLTPNTSAFKTYNSSPLAPRTPKSANVRKQIMLKRSISFLRSLNLMRLREGIQATRPTSSQLHHMISERKRREKLNESFHTLKSLLPPGTKVCMNTIFCLNTY